MPKQRQSNQGRVSPSDELTSAKQDVELGQSHMDVTLSVWRDSELASKAQGGFRCVAGRWGFGKGASRYSPLSSGVGLSSTTLGRWHSGYHGFKPKLTNELLTKL